ncbi:glycoside hydrolase family 127 protein [Mangrovibacterium lignilyticum]|uniref:glycoside hydrolase family 127 protein n=1 Tax=Mangrovibacterium lignilyticum TaxID=2668052 RepID=UPI0013D4F185|nr:glycoside hydrolase family 127 protein [Mangrovibacterium lignilyticum]
MKIKLLIHSLTALTIACSMSRCQPKNDPHIRANGREVVEFKVLTFPLEDVKLLDGPFKKATELNVESLLNYEPDCLLAKFRTEAGLEPKAEHYHGWEDNTIAGHSLGHYLSAICMMYKTTGDEQFLKRVKYIVDELEECQKADGDGYIGAFPDGKRILEEEVAKGDIRSQGFDLNGIWVPFYTQHKVMMGLMDAYKLCGIQKALTIEMQFADWLDTVVRDLNDDQIQEMLNCEHGGINEALAELFEATGKAKYMGMTNSFYHKVILDSLAHEKDILPGKHANTQIPKLVGLARIYELTGNEDDRTAAEFFWDRVVRHHSYVTGGHCDHEYFGPPDTLRNRLSDGTTETCNVYNMLKLSNHLFEWDANPEVADFYERALFNHILSSQNPHDGRVIYNLSLEMGGHKVYQDPLWFTCCVGTGMENHSKYGRNIYYHNNEELYVSQFIASELTWQNKGLRLTQETGYPDEQATKLIVNTDKPLELTLQLRYPYWANQGFEISVNGEKQNIETEPGSFVALKRKWQDGDIVEMKMPFSLRLESMPDDSSRAAVMYGPLVLAGDLGPENDPKAGELMYVPVLMAESRNPADWMEAVPGEPNTFKTKNIGRPRDVVFKPFYETHERRYSVYFDFFNEQNWNEKQAEYRAKQEQQKKIERMTIDYFQMGEMQPERDHNFAAENAFNDQFKQKRYRQADRGGWFSFDMGVYSGQPMALAFEYWGGFPGSLTFDILVEGTKIATENLSNAKPGEFFYKIYELPDSLTVNGGKIKVKLAPHKGHRAGPVFSVRTMKR